MNHSIKTKISNMLMVLRKLGITLTDEELEGIPGFNIGYKVVSFRRGDFRSLYEVSKKFSMKIGEEIIDPAGIFLGTTEAFVRDYYTGLTDLTDALITLEYHDDDVIEGDPEEDGEIKVSKAKVVEVELINSSTEDQLYLLREKIASVAQSIYDEWTQDEEGYDEEVGVGGICHLIADAIVEELYNYNIESESIQYCIGENHTAVEVTGDEGKIIVDIPPYVYEAGAGYVWKKKDGVTFRPDDVSIYRV